MLIWTHSVSGVTRDNHRGVIKNALVSSVAQKNPPMLTDAKVHREVGSSSSNKPNNVFSGTENMAAEIAPREKGLMKQKVQS